MWIRLALLFLATACALPAQSSVIQLLGRGLSGWEVEFHPRLRERATREVIPAFSFEGDVLKANGAVGNVGFLRYRQPFCDFELKAEFRAPAGTNNGICFRAPAYDRETPAHTGYELQIYLRDVADQASATGALYSVKPPLRKVSLSPDTWHTARILARGTHIQAWINDVLVQDFDQSTEEATRNRPACGYISIQNHGGDTEFRHITVAPLDAP